MSEAQGGKKTALIAVAHTLLLLVHHTLAAAQPFEERQTPGLCPSIANKIQHHIRRLGKPGISIPRYVTAAEPPGHTPRRPPTSG